MAPYITNQVGMIMPASNIIQAVYYYMGIYLYHVFGKFSLRNTNIKFDINSPKLINRKWMEEIIPKISKDYKYGVVFYDG